MYKIAICDDNQTDIKILKEALQKHPNHILDAVFYEYSNGESLIKDIDKSHNLIFLDMQMPSLNGHQTALEIRKKNKLAVLVFYSGIHDPSTDNFKVQPFRYIKKDMSIDTLNSEFGEILEEVRNRFENSIFIAKTNNGVEIINMKEAIYVNKHKYAAEIFSLSKDNKVTSIVAKRTRVDDIYEQYKNIGFEYAHNSYIVNIKKIDKIEDHTICLDGNINLNISKSKFKFFTSRMNDFLISKH